MSTLTMKALAEQIEQLTSTVTAQGEIIASQGSLIESLQAQLANMPKGRDRGPNSEGSMSEDDAIRCMIGDLRNFNHKDAALVLKLSYGQVYSARKGYTFKPIYKRMKNGETVGDATVPTADLENAVKAELENIAAEAEQEANEVNIDPKADGAEA